MLRALTLVMAFGLVLAGCTETAPTSTALGADGKPLPTVYRIRPGEASRLQFRMLDSLNTLREARGATPVVLDAQLNAAAATHARDMSAQNRPWHFGSDGSSPIDRVQRVGYRGLFLGEVISETYETELETLGAWMEDQGTRTVLMDANARDMGFAWFQEDNGKIWWTLVMGGGEPALAGF